MDGNRVVVLQRVEEDVESSSCLEPRRSPDLPLDQKPGSLVSNRTETDAVRHKRSTVSTNIGDTKVVRSVRRVRREVILAQGLHSFRSSSVSHRGFAI